MRCIAVGPRPTRVIAWCCREGDADTVPPIRDTFGDSTYCQEVLPGDVADEVIKSKQRPTRGLAKLKFGTIVQLHIHTQRRVNAVRRSSDPIAPPSSMPTTPAGAAGGPTMATTPPTTMPHGAHFATHDTAALPPKKPRMGVSRKLSTRTSAVNEVRFLKDFQSRGDLAKSRMKLAQSTKFQLSFSSRGCKVVTQ